MRIKWNIRTPEDIAFSPFQNGEVTFTEKSLRLNDLEIPYAEIDAAELITRYTFMLPKRTLHLAAHGQLVMLGPIPSKEVKNIPLEFQHIKIKSFWSNEFFLIAAAVLLLLRFI